MSCAIHCSCILRRRFPVPDLAPSDICDQEPSYFFRPSFLFLHFVSSHLRLDLASAAKDRRTSLFTYSKRYTSIPHSLVTQYRYCHHHALCLPSRRPRSTAIMVQVGRVACITAPFLLSVAALVTLVLIFLAGTMEGNSTTGDLYFVKVGCHHPPY